MRLLGTFSSRRIALARAQLWADELQDRIRVEIPRRPERAKVWACELPTIYVINYSDIRR